MTPEEQYELELELFRARARLIRPKSDALPVVLAPDDCLEFQLLREKQLADAKARS